MARILVVDDARFMRSRCVKVLIENGHEAFEAENGAAALEKYRSIKPDVVLMDITMPEMDGLAALKAIREADPDARVIMCSAVGQQKLVLAAIQAGAKDFIVKPFRPERMLEAISRQLRRRAGTRSRR
ncbi:MAG TPA: response regulator [Limnochordia bacterium]